MILYTTVPHEQIFLTDVLHEPQMMDIDYRGIQMQVEYMSPTCFRIDRIISTDPLHYLDPDIQPGSLLHYSPSDFAR
ncbi:YlzJ-like family protein [Peribacillus sp. SCS-26]|uniref:YlzJ-like family protein n=1 Tax=Paraperibacillus marinus TaxID=3115295 RepID=UPI0039057B77